MILLFIGTTGSGKDTQAEILAEKQDYKIISTGQLMRDEIDRGTERGKVFHDKMEKGEWLTDAETYTLLREYLHANPMQKIIFTGAVRRVTQIPLMDEVLASLGQKLDKVIYFEISDQEVIQRLMKRGREDDTEEAIRTRLQSNRDNIQPILEVYRAQGKLAVVDATGDVEEIAARVQEALTK
jgi:adenylate kinase